jgi:pimeloyl-ACP methyl ester carboxylesterase
MLKKWKKGWMLLLACLAAMAAQAETVSLTLPNGVAALAEYRQGEPGKPAVILVPGFLQTHHFPIISRLTDTLAEEGYTVLAPTLTLGIPYRRQSLACEAIHTHTVGDGVAELDQWVRWLQAKNVPKIVLGGHSLGNVYNLAYLARHGGADGRIAKLIAISIVESALPGGEASRPDKVRALRRLLRQGDKSLLQEAFSFCRQYHATPQGLLSYLEWGPGRILATIQNSRTPITMIMGSRDERLGKDWLARLRHTRARVIVIQGANHFMDGEYEFDLLDHFLAEMKGV